MYFILSISDENIWSTVIVGWVGWVHTRYTMGCDVVLGWVGFVIQWVGLGWIDENGVMDPRPTVRSQSRRGCNRCINYSKLINFRAYFRRSSRACIGCQSFSLTFRVVLCILLEAAVTEENVESRLIGDLFRSYEPRARPQFNAVNISLGCWLENILELVNASQVSMHNMQSAILI